MNLNVSLLLLPALGLVYDKLLNITQDLQSKDKWRVIKVKVNHCQSHSLTNQVLQLFADHNIPVTISTAVKQEDPWPLESVELIFGDEFDLNAVNTNQSNQKIFLLRSKVDLMRSSAHVKGRTLFLIWTTQQIFCRNTLLAGGWVPHELPECISKTHRNTNLRRVSVFLQTDKYSYAEKQPSGNYMLTGFKGIVLFELKKYLNVTLRFVLPDEFKPPRNSPFRKWKTFIKPIQGVFMGKINDTLILTNDSDNFRTELYFWAKPYHHSSIYKSISLGKLNSLRGYYGAAIPRVRLVTILTTNYNYLLIIVLASLVSLLVLTKVLFSSSNHSPVGILIFDFIGQCLGQTRNNVYSMIYARILLITALFLAYIIWVLNCATLFSELAVTKKKSISSYAELNASNRDIFITKATLNRYEGVAALQSFRRLKIVEASELRYMIVYNNTGKAFLVEDMTINTNNEMRRNRESLYKLREPYASRMPAFAVSRSSPLAANLETFFHKIIESGLLSRYQLWADWFIRHNAKVPQDSPDTINLFTFWYIVQAFIASTIIPTLTFIGEIVYYRWQMRRRTGGFN